MQASAGPTREGGPPAEEFAAFEHLYARRARGFEVLLGWDPRFPAPLRASPDPLPLLFARRDMGFLKARCVSVAGSRTTTEVGVRNAARFARALAVRGTVVVSGPAAGIDAAAMRVPIERAHPKENRELQELVGRGQLLVSQVHLYHYDHQQVAERQRYFTERDATVASLSAATIVIEATERSGTRVCARECLRQGKPLVFLPAVIEGTSWAKRLLSRVAFVARSPTEAMELVGHGQTTRPTAAREVPQEIGAGGR